MATQAITASGICVTFIPLRPTPVLLQFLFIFQPLDPESSNTYKFRGNFFALDFVSIFGGRGGPEKETDVFLFKSGRQKIGYGLLLVFT